MSTQVKVVCPKCQARLKIAPEKIVSEMVKCKCPGCGTILRIKKPTQQQDLHSWPESPPAQTTGMDKTVSGDDVSGTALQPDSEQDYADKEKVGENVTQTQGRKVETQEKDEEDSEPEDERNFAETGNTRIFKRVKFKKKVLVDNQIMVEALDISENGLFLHTGRSFEMGAVIEVAIPTSPGNFDLKVQARVQHNHRGIGMGLMFIDVDETKKAKLQKLIDSLDAAAQQELEGRKKILLVGGSATARNINKSKLVLDGFYVMQGTSVEEVDKILQQERPDAVVMDWQETAFDCKGLFYRIKENRQNDNIVILVLSTLTDAAVQKEILDAGADRYMAKMDTNPAKLSMTLKNLIEERKS